MASYRVRVPLTGVQADSAVTIVQTAGATSTFLDVFVDSADVVSSAALERAIDMAHRVLRDSYRQVVGGV